METEIRRKAWENRGDREKNVCGFPSPQMSVRKSSLSADTSVTFIVYWFSLTTNCISFWNRLKKLLCCCCLFILSEHRQKKRIGGWGRLKAEDKFMFGPFLLWCVRSGGWEKGILIAFVCIHDTSRSQSNPSRKSLCAHTSYFMLPRLHNLLNIEKSILINFWVALTSPTEEFLFRSGLQ